MIPTKIRALKPNVSENVTRTLTDAIVRHCRPELIDITLAIAMKESSLNPNAVSLTSDYGLFQFNPTYHPRFTQPRTIDYQVSYFCHHLSRLARANPTDPEYWAYHHTRRKESRDAYATAVTVYLKKLASLTKTT